MLNFDFCHVSLIPLQSEGVCPFPISCQHKGKLHGIADCDWQIVVQLLAATLKHMIPLQS